MTKENNKLPDREIERFNILSDCFGVKEAERIIEQGFKPDTGQSHIIMENREDRDV